MNFKQLDFYKLALLLLFAGFIAVYYQNGNTKNNRYSSFKKGTGLWVIDNQTGVYYGYENTSDAGDAYFKIDVINQTTEFDVNGKKIKNK